MNPAPPIRAVLKFLSAWLALATSLPADQDPHQISDPLQAEAATLTAGSPAVAAVPASAPNINGSWGNVIPWTPHIPVTAATLPDGRLLTFAASERTTFPEGAAEFTYAAVWDPATGVFTEINNARHNSMCSGTAMLPDGRVVVNGGRNTTELSSIFDYRTNQWSAMQNMNDPRWYNTSATMPDGTLFTVSGSGGYNTAELWNSSTGWRRLTGVDWDQVIAQPGYINIWHPFLMLAPNGKMFHFGPTDVMNWVTTSGQGSLTPSGQNVPGVHYPKQGAWAMYDEGKILVTGGGDNFANENTREAGVGYSTNLCYTVDLNVDPPVVAQANPMQELRQYANAVVLPNGEVLIVGGNTSGIAFSDEGAILTPEIWNPQTGAWRTAADMSVPRTYHSVALLLPNGTVWSGGGGLAGNAADHQDAQIYTPPSLFDSTGELATRPVITSGPDKIGPGTQFTIHATPGLTKFSFIRMSAQTHSVHTDLRYLSLPFTETSPGTYTVTGHANPNVMVPGFWMLFGLDFAGVHSVSKVIQVSLNPDAAFQDPGSQQSITGDTVQLSLSVTAQPGVTIQYAATGLPGGLAINPGTGVISGTVTATPGDYWTTVDATPSIGNPFSTSFNWTVLPPIPGQGKVLHEWWLDINGSYIDDLTNNPAFPANPNGHDFLDQFSAPDNLGTESGQRIRGYLHPPVSGDYQFVLVGRDGALLLLSPTNEPEKAEIIAGVTDASKNDEDFSGIYTLEAGKTYFIDALVKSGTGYNFFAVGWLPPGGDNFDVIPGEFLSAYDSVNTPIAAWHFDEKSWNGTPGEAKETIGTIGGIDGTSVGGASTSSATRALTGNPGTGRSGVFNGIDQYVSVPNNAALNYDYFTVSAWVRPLNETSANTRAVASSLETVGGEIHGYGLFASADGKWTFSTGSGSNDLVGPDIIANQWTHIAATFRTSATDNNGVRTGMRRIFVNGIQVAEDYGTYVPVANAPFLIGASDLEGATGGFMNGNIDEVRMNAMPISPEDVATTMALRHQVNSGPNVTSPGPLTNLRNSVVSQVIIANDPNDDALTFSATGLPDGLSISPGSGIIGGSPVTAGEFNVTVTATDPDGDSGSASFVWSVAEDLAVTPVSAPPSAAGTSVSFSASVSGGNNPSFQWNFGDGTPDSQVSSSPTVTHDFPGPGRYLVTVTASDDSGSIVSGSYYQAIHAPLTSARPANSSPVCYESRSSGNDHLWVVNPDNDSTTVIDAASHAKLAEIQVGTSPHSVAIAPDGRIWITNTVSATVSIINPDTFAVVTTLHLQRGSRPFGLAFSPDGSAAYIALEDAGKLLRLDPVTGAQIASTDVGANVRHLSIPGDSSCVYISRFVTPKLPGEETATINTSGHGGEVVVVNSSTNTITQTLLLHHSEQVDTESSARGIPNYLGAATISPDGLSAWVPSKQDNIKRGKLRDNQDLTHETSVRSIASRLDLTLQSEDSPARIDFDNAGIPSAIAYDPWGIYAFVALEASRAVAVVDVWNHREIFRFAAGRAPQGLTVSPDGHTLYVHNFMDRSVSIHDISALVGGLSTPPPSPTIVQTITTEKLTLQVLVGKQLFYDAKDNRLALQEYISCAACHNDGGQDGRVWDFTGFGEGLRNTISLRGHGGTRQGPLHWSGNFDEVQDFENQIRNFAGGLGLISGNSPHPPLDAPNAGLSPDLDALAAYVQSLDKSGDSPHRQNDGSLTSAAHAGELVFRTLDCASCHGGPEFTRSATGNFPDIGTLKPSSGNRLGQPLTGLDIPTLRGVWNTAPYLHDGSAATLEQAVTAHQNVVIGSVDLANLVAYLQSIDDESVSAPLPTNTFAGWAQVTPGADGNPNSDGDGDHIPDLLEFALGGLPDNPASPAADAITIEKSAGSFKMHVKCPAGLKGLTWEVLTSGDLKTWTVAPAVPLIEPGQNGMETMSFENLQNQPGITETAGYARLRVSMDQNPPP